MYKMEACEAHWIAMNDAIAVGDRKLAKQHYVQYHEGINNLEKTQGITISRHELDMASMLFMFPLPENIIRD